MAAAGAAACASVVRAREPPNACFAEGGGEGSSAAAGGASGGGSAAMTVALPATSEKPFPAGPAARSTTRVGADPRLASEPSADGETGGGTSGGASLRSSIRVGAETNSSVGGASPPAPACRPAAPATPVPTAEATAVPQRLQKRARSGRSLPQDGQFTTAPHGQAASVAWAPCRNATPSVRSRSNARTDIPRAGSGASSSPSEVARKTLEGGGHRRMLHATPPTGTGRGRTARRANARIRS